MLRQMRLTFVLSGHWRPHYLLPCRRFVGVTSDDGIPRAKAGHLVRSEKGLGLVTGRDGLIEVKKWSGMGREAPD